MVDVKTYSLTDSQWADLEIGTSGKTVKQIGLSSLCAASCLGVDPINFVTKMNTNNGYTKTGQLRWAVASSLFDGNLIHQTWKKIANISWITSLSVKGFPVILDTRLHGFVVMVDPDFMAIDFTNSNSIKVHPEDIAGAFCFQKIPGTTDYMGKNQEYWISLEKTNKELSERIEKLVTEAHESSITVDGVRAKADSLYNELTFFVKQLATKLNTPAKKEEILAAIGEELSTHDSVERLSKEIAILKQALATEMSNSTMFQHEYNEAVVKLDTTQKVLTQTATQLNQITQVYRELEAQTGGKPRINLHFFGKNLKLY